MPDPRYPVGQLTIPPAYSRDWRNRAIAEIAETPRKFRAATAGLSPEQLDTPYRDGGWTVRQVIHHLPDSHLNAYVRLKLALTEDAPTIKPYDEARWAALADSSLVPVEVSLSLLESLHERWVTLLRSMSEGDFERPYEHPETGRHDLNYLVAMYSWHGRHHTAHITTLREERGW